MSVASETARALALILDKGRTEAKSLITPVYNILGYGANGGGVDDSAAIQDTINAALVTGGTVFFPPGEWLAVNLQVPKGAGTRIRFAGSGVMSVLRLKDNSAPLIVLAGTADTVADRVNDFEICDMALFGSGLTGTTAHGIDARFAHRTHIRRVLIQDIPGDGIRFTGTSYDSVISDCIIWQNKGVGIRDASATNQITPLWLDRCRVENNTLGGVEITSPTFHMNMCTVEQNDVFDLYAHGKAHGAVTNTHFEVMGKDRACVLVGDTTESTQPQLSFFGCEFYGNRNTYGATANLIGAHLRKASRVLFSGCRFVEFNVGVKIESTGGHVVLFAQEFNNNVSSTSGQGTSHIDWRDGNVNLAKGGSITMYGGTFKLNSGSKFSTDDAGASFDFDGKSLTNLLDVTLSGNVTAYRLHITNAMESTAGAAGGASALPATPVGYMSVKVGANFYKIPVYNN